MSKPPVQAASAVEPYVCCGCGKPYIENAYKDCDCASACGFRRGSPQDIITAHPRCAWCSGYPIHTNLDGEPLCWNCCNRWARGEGLGLAEDTSSLKDTPDAG